MATGRRTTRKRSNVLSGAIEEGEVVIKVVNGWSNAMAVLMKYGVLRVKAIEILNQLNRLPVEVRILASSSFMN